MRRQLHDHKSHNAAPPPPSSTAAPPVAMAKTSVADEASMTTMILCVANDDMCYNGYGVGNGHCSPYLSIEECCWDGGDCIFFGDSCTVSPDCDAYEVGDGYCSPFFNIEACCWDGGDCTFGDCEVSPECSYEYGTAGDGYCTARQSTDNCCWDGGDCIFGDCIVSPKCDSHEIGSGYCNPNHSTKDCCWDGGDCIFNDCVVSPECGNNRHDLGDGNCNDELNKESCCWDGGDCISEDKRSEIEVVVIVTICILVPLLALFFFFLVKSNTHPARAIQPQEPGQVSTSDDENRDSAPLTTQEIKSERREKILARILRKKVRSKSNAPVGNHVINDTDNEVALLEDEDIYFPHEHIMALRSIHSSMNITWHNNANNGETTGTRDDYDAVILASVVPSRAGSSAHSIAAGVFGNKNDILVNTLHSIRSNLNITIDHSNKSSMYSPKTCPVCFGDYVKGDDIAWSKNEQCCHAFHTDCILEWLMNHDECPMCRNNYLQETEEA